MRGSAYEGTSLGNRFPGLASPGSVLRSLLDGSFRTNCIVPPSKFCLTCSFVAAFSAYLSTTQR